MRQQAWVSILALALAGAQGAAAQTAPGPSTLNEAQRAGQKIFYQSCGECHTKPLINAPAQYGPVLSKEAASGNDKAIRQVISDGTPRMPGFKYTYTPEQIAALAAYIEILPAPQH
jgi:mono/diheme cytochrome c family protein